MYEIKCKRGLVAIREDLVDTVMIKRLWRFSRYSVLIISLRNGSVVNTGLIKNCRANFYYNKIKSFLWSLLK